MAIKIGSNFTFQGEQPNFERDRFVTKAGMKAFPETSIDDGHLSYCMEDKNTYQFKSSNSVDATTGKWRLFKADVDLSAYATKDSVAKDLDKKIDISGVKNDFIKAAPYIIKIATITIPHIENVTGTIDLNIQSRHDVFNLNIYAVYTTNFANLDVKVFDTSVNTTDNKLYYCIDNTNLPNKIVLYYKAVPYDLITVKITNLTGTLKLDCSIDCDSLDYSELPEDVIPVTNINNSNKNLFYATPKDAAGNPKFRAIDITDLPDLSSKYATKEKAFTKDTVSTEPNQFLAGPINTKGNIGLRKIDISDIPNLNSKYQPINGNGFQEGPKAVGLLLGYRTKIGYLKAVISVNDTTSQVSPDWYYATDGTLQDIKVKAPKVVLDDTVSTTSSNGVKNSVITKYVDSKVTTINSSITDIRTSLESTQTDFVDLRNKVNAMPKTVFITQADYDALSPKDANTIYYING